MIPRLTVERSIPAPGSHLCGLAWDGRHLWHSDAGTNLIYRIQPESGAIIAQIPCPEVRTDLAFDGQNLWQIAGRPKKIVVIDQGQRGIVSEIPLRKDQEHACGLCIQGDRYWVAYEHLGRIREHITQQEHPLAQYKVMPRVAGLEIVDHTLWYAEYERSMLVAIDLVTGKEVQRYSIPGNPTGLAWDGKNFWYSDFTNRLISAVRPI